MLKLTNYASTVYYKDDKLNNQFTYT